MMKYFSNLLKPKFFIPLIAVLVVCAGFFIWWQGFSGNVRVTMEVEGPKEIFNGQQNSFLVKFENKTNQEWQNTKLVFSLPSPGVIDGNFADSLYTKDLGRIGLDEKKEIPFDMRLFGSVDQSADVLVKLSYQPVGSLSTFESEKQLHVKFIGTILEVSFESLVKDKNGQLVANIIVTNKDRVSFENIPLTFKIIYPDRFTFASANPFPDVEKNTWFINDFKAGESRTFVVKGWSGGSLENIRPFQAKVTADIGNKEVTLSEANSLSQISADGLVIFQTVNHPENSPIQWGQALDYQVHFRNATSAPWPDLVVEVNVDPNLIDTSRSRFQNGFYDSGKGIVRFDKTNAPELALLQGGKEGTLSFSLALVGSPPTPVSRNYSLKTTASIKSEATDLESEALSAQDMLNLKILTKAGLLSKGYYHNQFFIPVGTIPPQVGIKTGYVFVWQISNVSNDISGAQAVAYLGPNVEWGGQVFPKNSSLRYDENKRQVIWNIGSVPAGTGFEKPSRQVAFQLLFTPKKEQAGQLGLLLGQARFSGYDAFASASVEAVSDTVYTDIPEDPSSVGLGIIQQ